MSQITFQYRAINRDGARTRGEIHAADRAEAYRQIVATGLKPVDIRTRRAARGAGRITPRDLSHITYQFAVLLEARIPIVDGLLSIAEQEQKAGLRAVLENVARQIEGGSSVTDAITPHRRLFGDVYVETVRAAEVSGNMIEVFNHLATMLETQAEMGKRIKGAMMYPITVVGALTLAMGFLMLFVVPRFATIFESRGVDLPLPTQVLLSGSAILRGYWWLLLGLAIGGVLGVRRAWQSPESRQRIDGWLHRVPVVCQILRGVAVSRFAAVFGLSLRSGLSLIDALEMAGRASGRPLLRTDAEKMRDQVNVGGRLSDVLFTCSYLPSFAKRMMSAGEDSGDMSRMCEIVSRHYDREVSHLTKNIATVVEPVMIVGLAGIVLVVALAIFLPMWNMAALF